MIICGNHVHKFSVSKDMKNKSTMITINNKRRRDMVVGNSGGALYIMFENHVHS
jgi:hypothetical protein